ncbi:MAG: VWA domain-containing protein [Verrucomicrobiota bacterium]
MILPFAYPWVLFLLVVPLAMLAWFWRWRNPTLVLPFDHSGAKRGRVLRFFLDFASSFPALLLAVVIIILAGPQQLSEPKTMKVLTNIQFCLDVSGSMTAQYGGEGDRYDAAMEAINEFISYREGDAFGLTVFGDHFLHWLQLTTDPTVFQYATPFLGPRRLPTWFSGGTAIGKAARECMKLLIEREEGDRMIILVTDGSSADLYGGNDVKIAAELAANNIVVYAISITEGSPNAQLATLAQGTGGQVFSAGDPDALNVVFQRIDEMQETRMEKVSAESVDWFRPFALTGLGLLGMHGLCLFGIRYTPW